MNVRNYREVETEPVGNEPGLTFRWLTSELEAEASCAMFVYEMAARVATEPHTHYQEQTVIVLTGKGTVIGAEGEFPVSEGDVICIPPAEGHHFVNSSDEALRLLVVMRIPRGATFADAA